MASIEPIARHVPYHVAIGNHEYNWPDQPWNPGEAQPLVCTLLSSSSDRAAWWLRYSLRFSGRVDCIRILKIYIRGISKCTCFN